MNLGEGLAFYLVCAGFFILYTLYTAICTATGCLLLAWPAEALHSYLNKKNRLDKKSTLRNISDADFSHMRQAPVLAIGILGLVGHIFYVLISKQKANATMFLTVPIMQGFGVFFLLTVIHRFKYLESNVLIIGENIQTNRINRENTIVARRVFLLWLVISPILVVPERLFLVDSAFKLAQLRKDNATIHVKMPWAVKVKQSTLSQSPSFLGDDHIEFKNVKVLLRSVGEKVIIEIPTDKGIVKLPIPSDSIYVE